MIRLQKYIADCGVTSRRKAEEYITAGRVKVNGEKVTELGTKVDPAEDVVMVDGAVIDRNAVDPIYIVLHKPRCYMTTVNDPEGRKTVIDLLRGLTARVFPVGRLDYLSEGLLLMTNDGEMANKVSHPRFEVEKVYEVKVFGAVNSQMLSQLKKGIHAHDGHLKPKSVRVIKQLPTKTWIEFRLQEGKNREIRRICDAAGLVIDKLKRVAIEGLSIDGIAPGEFRFITKIDLLRALNMNKDGSKVKKDFTTYISPKRSIKLNETLKQKRYFAGAPKTDDEKFDRYKKDEYNKTMQIYKDLHNRVKSNKATSEKRN